MDYGPIDCWWWEADVLDEKRMSRQLAEMKSMGIAGTWYYPRLIYGEAMEPTPAYWTKEWWDFFRFSMQEHERLGLVAWTSDWTAAEYFQQELRGQRERNPWLWGKRLALYQQQSSSAESLSVEIRENENLLWAAAFEKGPRGLTESTRRDIDADGGKVTFQAPGPGWVLTVVVSQPYDLDYMNRKIADSWIETLLGTHEKNLGRFMGTTLQAYGTDELIVLRGNILYSDHFLERFRKEKGYDPLPLLAGLFLDLGAKTDKIRCEYYDVMITLLEENLFKPFADWLHDRNMIYTEFCPNGKWMDMLGQTFHYGDFFRYMRHYDYPGNEEDTNRTRTFQAKLASSIAHLYERERTGLCAYWGSGWGHNLEENLRWTNENYAYGINLYNRHGNLYSTLGGWYEWVPPAVHFRQPYWRNWRGFTDHVRRLSYILSQGKHVADVAILYPITTIQANWFSGNEFGAAADDAANTAFSLARTVYDGNLDCDFIDFESLQKARVEDGKLKVSGLEFPVLLIPPLTTIRTKTLEKVKEFFDGGGVVVAYRRLPHATAENGREDPTLRSLLSHIFGLNSTEAHHHSSEHRCTAGRIFENKNPKGGRAYFVPSEATRNYRSLTELISGTIDRDVLVSEPGVYHVHQKTDDLDFYFLFNTRSERRSIELVLRVTGKPELWDTFCGETRDIHRFEDLSQRQKRKEIDYEDSLNRVDGITRNAPRGGTRLRLSMEPDQGVLVVFNRSSPERPSVVQDNLTEITTVRASDNAVVIHGFCDTSGKKSVHAVLGGRTYIAEARVEPPPTTMLLEGYWLFRLEPTLDNRWGDFRFPATQEHIGAEARSFKYMPEGPTPGQDGGWIAREYSDANWTEHTYTYGPYWWDTGPLSADQARGDLLERALQGKLDLDQWSPYGYSQKFGSADKTVQNTHGGLFGVAEDFMVFEATGEKEDLDRYLFTNLYSPRDQELTFDFGGREVFPRAAWLNGGRILSVDGASKTRTLKTRITRLEFSEKQELDEHASVVVNVNEGWNPLLLKLTQPEGRRIGTYAVFYDGQRPPVAERYVPLLKWFRNTSDIRYDILPEMQKRAGRYRFEAPPGTSKVKLPLKARNVEAWIDGMPVKVEDDTIILPAPKKHVSLIALRVEHEPAYYGGAAFEEPVAFTCDQGLIDLGDWCGHALESYSGAAVYTKTVDLDAGMLAGKTVLDLGKVNSTAEVRVNGNYAGLRMARPYIFDVSALLKVGANSIEITVCNTLANHYSSYPSQFVYAGQAVSGILGPVKLHFLRGVIMTAKPEAGTDFAGALDSPIE